MTPLDFNHICAIAATLDDMTNDPDIQVYIEGDMAMQVADGVEFSELQEGEASRMVVAQVLAHPYIKAVIDEREALWTALKWVLMNVDHLPTPPEALQPAINAAIDAGMVDDNESLA